jgi:hypothetical protein
VLVEKRGERSVSCEWLGVGFCDARSRDRIVWVAREDIIVVACVFRWLFRDRTVLLLELRVGEGVVYFELEAMLFRRRVGRPQNPRSQSLLLKEA